MAKDLRKAEVLKKFGLDFCCGGKKTLEAACREKGLDVLAVRAELEKPQTAAVAAQHDFGSWNLAFLADYIVNVHHGYVKNNLPILLELGGKVAKRHGDVHPELIKVYDKLSAMGNELILHMKKEETILFPYIKQVEARANGQDAPQTFTSVKEPVAVMENDHDIVGRLAEDIRTLTNNYTLPENACNSYGLLFKKAGRF